MDEIEAMLAALQESIPHITAVAGTTIVAKLGGSTLGSHDTSLKDVVALSRLGVKIVLVHGGGATISQWLGRIGQQPRFINGLRVTDEAAMEVVTMVLAGKVNKSLVAEINTHGGRAIGLSGVDGSILQGRQISSDLGLVGEVTTVNTAALSCLLQAGFLPVVAPIALGSNGEALNVNADTAAAEIAAALAADRLIFLTDVPGIKGKDGEVFASLDAPAAKQLIADGIIAGGMIPKAQACLKAVETIPAAHIIDGRVPLALMRELLTQHSVGTTIGKVENR